MAWTTALVLLLGIAAYGVAGDSFLTKLANYVKSHSDPDVAPQKNANTPVQVSFVYTIGNIAEVDKEHNTFTAETYVRTHWDTGITWDKDDAQYGGVDRITLPGKYFWTPRMQPVHTAVEVRDLSPYLVLLKSDGMAAYNQFYRMQGLCDVSHIESGASCNGINNLWGYSKDQVNISQITGDNTGIVTYFEGSRYEITDFGIQFNEVKFDNKDYQLVNFQLDIKEKPRDSNPVNLRFDFH